MSASIVVAAWLAWGAANAPAEAKAVLLHLADDDGAAAHELAALAERHGKSAAPPMRVATPDPALSRLAAAKQACTPGVLGVFWLDAQRGDEWRLYALPCATKRPLLREIIVSNGAEQAAIEASWLIVRSSAVAIAEGHELAMVEANPDAIDVAPAPAPVPAPPPAPVAKPVPPAPSRKDLGLRASVAYAGEGLARAIPWRSGVSAALAWAARPRLRIGGWYEFQGGGRLDDPPGFRAWRHGIALTIAGVFPVVDRLAIELRGGPELELSRWRSRPQGKGSLRPIPRIGADAALQIGLGRRPHASRIALDVGVGLGVALIDVDFVTCAANASPCAGPDRKIVADAWRVRPRARAGLSVQF